MATTIVTATKAPPQLRCSFSNCRRLDPAKKQLKGTIKFVIHNANPSSARRVQRSFIVQAKGPQIEDQGSSTDNNSDSSFTFQDDLNYLLKLGAGSVIGAAVIKYGSIVFPEITRPNIYQALIMILAPVIVSVILLAKQTRVEQ